MAKKTAIESKEHQEADHLFEMICDRLHANIGAINENRLRQAFELALSAHEGQERMDGTPYIYHPLEVAEICVDLNMEEDSVIAALLHDTVEDTAVRQNQIRQLFGNDVANMVDNLTKIKKIDFFARFTGRNKASNQARNLQRLFVAMTRDTRVIVIKLADRLHNMKTLGPMPAHKRDRISRETLEFYIPIARRLGLGDIATKLEDLVFEALLPEQFEQLKRDVTAAVALDEPVIEVMVAEVKRMMAEAGLDVDRVFGRRKHLWSVFQKMQKQGVKLDGIYDLLAIRIILRCDELECYKALGVIHTHYKPIFHRFRDFIASPKENGYQTLHTTVIGNMGSRVECQIRTSEMDNAASKGVAAHWNYKESGRNINRLIKDEAWLEFIRELSEEDMDSDDFVARTRDTLLGDQVLVLSPKGEVVNLPVGSTPIDFAYYIHTDLGHAIRNAKINGLVVPLDYQLRNGDVVEVIKSEEKNPAPRPEWLMLAKSPKSLLKIRRYFRSLPRQERIAVGRNLLRMQIVKEGLYPLNLTANEKLAQLLRHLPVRSIDELYENVAMGTFHTKEIVDRLRIIHRARVEPQVHVPVDGHEHSLQAPELALIGYAGDLGVRMAGGQPLRRRVEIMNCCTPVPGDKIYGVNDFEQRRVSVHRVECPALHEEIPRGGELLELDWTDDHDDKRYPCRVIVIGINRVGLLFEVLRYLSSNNVNLGGGSFSSGPTVVGPDRNARFELVVEVANTDELNDCIAAIGEMDDIFEVTRQIRLPTADGDGAPS
jgi:GTP diphosphokinase / guanosine-3',5'-bis(diphosphate) 3'-diphosphatase